MCAVLVYGLHHRVVAVQLVEVLDMAHPHGRVAVQIKVIGVVGIRRRNDVSLGVFDNNRELDAAFVEDDPLAGGVDSTLVGLREGDFGGDARESVLHREAA